MGRTQTMVQLRDDLLELLDREATERGVSRSAVIREAIEHHLAVSVRAEVGRRIVAGYERVPQSEPDEWGNVEFSADVAHRELLQRLDREEADAGHEPW